MNNEVSNLTLTRTGIQQLLEQSGYDNANPEEKAAFISGIRHREAFLLAEQEQSEPVAYVDDAGVIVVCSYKYKAGDKLYTTPQQRKPLDCFETEKLAKQCGVVVLARVKVTH